MGFNRAVFIDIIGEVYSVVANRSDNTMRYATIKKGDEDDDALKKIERKVGEKAAAPAAFTCLPTCFLPIHSRCTDPPTGLCI